MLYIHILTTAAFCIASYTDIKRREIPLTVSAGLFLACLIYRMKFNINLTEYLEGMTAFGVAGALCAAGGMMGGGDILILSYIGFLFGIRRCILFAVITSAVSVVTAMTCKLYTKKCVSKTMVPMMPIITISYFICLIAIGMYQRHIA